MDKETIKSILVRTIPLSVQDGYVARKRTVPDTSHVGVLSGNRLNSGTLRSQFIVYEKVSDWNRTDETAKKAIHSDQRIFVQKSNDVWDVYRGRSLTTENESPVLVSRNAVGLAKQIEIARREIHCAEIGVDFFDGKTPRQLITYGAPGTGKSHNVDGLANNPDVAACVRTTFHPDSDYATFVGAYKPVMDGEKIAYKFRPQAFMNAYVKAWQEMAKSESDGKVKSVVLVIEEINRGNCAQIFGDLFQLLDRGKGGYSTYPIDADADLAKWLAEQFGNTLAQLVKPDDIKKEADWEEILVGRKLALPPNLYIWATMNTSDQSLFPIDSAFKRRWDWEYVPIAKPDKSDDPDWKERKIEVGDSLFDWWDFLSAINGHIAKATESEDKQLGYFFVKADDATGCISAEQFANKVLFYLYGDVFKSYELPKKDCFQQADNTVLKFRDFFYSEKVEEGEGENRVTHKPGDVKLDVVAAFLRGLKWKEKGVKEEPKGGAADANPD